MEENLTKTARNAIFQQLKPICIELSQLALRYNGDPVTLQALEATTSDLLQILKHCCQFSTRDFFDEKIADYVFFPLSHIFRAKEKRSDKLVDLTIQCVRMLLKVGWSKKIDPALSTQLLILFTFLAGGTIGDESTNVSEEVKKEAFGALQDLFASIGGSPMVVVSLIHSDTIPALGHCVTTILEGITDGPSPEIQEQALLALHSLWLTIKDQEALANFFPGTVSSLTKTLMPSTQSRRSRKVLVLALQILERVFTSVLSDVRTHTLLSRAKHEVENRSGSRINSSWLKATAAQVKLALANVVKLRDHADQRVRNALKHLCIVVLDECHDSLSDTASMIVETWMTLASTEEPGDGSREYTSLADLANIHSSIAELIKNISYNWVSSLPRIMQLNDETAKHKRMQQVSLSFSLMSGLNIESEFLSVNLVESLINSTASVLEAEKMPPGVQKTEVTMMGSLPLVRLNEFSRDPHFSPIIMPHNSQKQNREDFLALVARLGTSESQLKMASETLEYMRNASGPSQLAAYWLSFNLVKVATEKSREFDELFSLDSHEGSEEAISELYSFSTGILASDETETVDWRLHAIAVEVVAYAAQSQKLAFRTELIGVLYPIVQLIGSSNAALREHAMTGLNIVSKTCGYVDTSDLIVENVDYMVNAISMRLNTFDISPQAPQVLIMMIRLSGPTLLPFLDDVIGSIFAALDNFHGYTQLVEVLFLVLGEVVDSGSKSDMLQITPSQRSDHRKTHPSYPSVAEIAKGLQKLQESAKDDHEKHEEFPREPWKSAKTLLDEANPAFEAEDDQQEKADAENQELAKISPPTKTYSMLQSITRLGQHYLTNQSSLLRRRLLDLIRTASAALSSNEDEFLPLVNDIWPVLIKRLYDSEPFVVTAACEALAELCRSSGDFLSTRFASEWSDMRKLIMRIKGKAEEGKKGAGARGIYAQDQQVWQALVDLLVAMMEYVRVEDEMFDDVVEMLGDLLVSREDVRQALSVVNADAVWLEIYKRQPPRRLKIEPPPVLDTYLFVAVESLL